MDLRMIATDSAPRAIGPYSQAIVAGGVVYCSGQVGLDPANNTLVAGGPAAQARQALRNLGEALRAAGAAREQVVKTTLFLTDLADFEAVNAVYAEFFGPCRPARSTVQVARLPRDAAVEVDAMAVVG